MEIQVNVYPRIVYNIEEANFIIILRDYEKFFKDQIYELIEDKYGKLSLINEDFEYDNTPLDDFENNILFALSYQI